jgi:hypothetical protein
MSGLLGIEHPLVLFRDLNAAVTRFRALGFSTTPVGRHPWGTEMSLVQFDRCSIELMSIFDPSLVDEKPVGDFRFGRYQRECLTEREGMSLIALYSSDAEEDASRIVERGIACQGTVKFGRDVLLPDGQTGRTATSLKILHDPHLPRVSHFICQQHRPDLIWVPEWLSHPNGAVGIASVTYYSPAGQMEKVRARFAGLYGRNALFAIDCGFGVHTGNGVFQVLDETGINCSFGQLPKTVAEREEPCGVAIAVRVAGTDRLTAILDRNGVIYGRSGNRIRLGDPESYGNVWLNFVEEG